MHNFYVSQDGLVRETDHYTDNCWIKLTNPTEKECKDLSEQFNLELTDVRAALDEDEASRVIAEPGYTLILIDIPAREAVNVAFSYTTIPIGIFITPTCVITVCARETPVIKDITKSTGELFSTVINNRLNDVMKLLTSITIVMTLPTIIAGIWGMNVALPFGRNPFGFLIVLLITLLVCIITVIILHKKKML